MSVDDPSNYKQAHAHIKYLLTHGSVQFVDHADERVEKRGWESTDVLHIIRYGKIILHTLAGQFWRYTIEGQTVDAQRGKCVVEVRDHLIVITMMMYPKRR